MSFTAHLRQIKIGSSTVNISNEWGQGRAAFGGIVAGLVYESMQRSVEGNTSVRSLHVSFVGPVSSEDFHIKSEVLRQGKSVAQVVGKGKQNGETQVLVVGSFGKPRSSQISLDDSICQFPEDPLSIEPMPYVPGVIPEFTKFFDFKYCTAMPFSNSEGCTLRGFVRFKDETEIGIAHLLGLIDAWPPAVLPMLNKPAPASSLNWNIEFVYPRPTLSADEFCRYQADIMFAHDGYACTRAKVWNQKGELLATSQQMTVAFA